MTSLVTSVVVEQPLRSDVRARPSFKRHARPFPAPAPQSAAALLLFTDSHSSLTAFEEVWRWRGYRYVPVSSHNRRGDFSARLRDLNDSTSSKGRSLGDWGPNGHLVAGDPFRRGCYQLLVAIDNGPYQTLLIDAPWTRRPQLMVPSTGIGRANVAHHPHFTA